MGVRGIEKLVDKYLERAGINAASVESLRHTFGAYQAARGNSLQSIQKMMGHQDVRTTEIYLELARDFK